MKECRILLTDLPPTGDVNNSPLSMALGTPAFKWWDKLPGTHQRRFRGPSDAQNLVSPSCVIGRTPPFLYTLWA